MTIGEIIGPDQVMVGVRVTDKRQLLQDLAGRAATALALDRGVIFDALQARENLGSTGLGKGFALPHARLDGLNEPFALFMRLGRPIDFAAIDEKPVDLVILLLRPGGRQQPASGDAGGAVTAAARRGVRAKAAPGAGCGGAARAAGPAAPSPQPLPRGEGES